jgi:hemerythrin-like domain-containing protein
MTTTTNSTLIKVRDRVLNDHHGIRPVLAKMLWLAAELERNTGTGAECASALRLLVVDFVHRFERHLSYEDSRLIPLVSRQGEWGKEHAAGMRREHTEQRDMIRRIEREAKLADALTLAREVREFVQCVRADMNGEERDLRLLGEEEMEIGVCSG